MENKIRVLDAQTVGRIAAGEAVERPASVLKELVENAVDAHAGAVTVEIRDGGISYLRVTDNGEGIRAEDVGTAFVRHGTSKIRSSEDLSGIMTLGFRGEALPSIAAVSRIEMITKTADAVTGIRYTAEGGTHAASEEIGAPDGTTVIVRDLFFNTPARAKFLRSPVTEGARCASCIEYLALSHPDVSFTFLSGGKTRIVTSGRNDIRETVYDLYGKDIASSLIPVSGERGPLSVRGVIARPHVFRANRSFENYFINGRFIKSDVIRRGIEDGYGHRLMRGNYPFTVLYLDVSPGSIDVNVHPTKMEVRLGDEQAFYLCVRDSIAEALSSLEMIRPAEQRIPNAAVRPGISHMQVREPFEKRQESISPYSRPDAPVNHAAASAEKKGMPDAHAVSGADPGYGTHKEIHAEEGTGQLTFLTGKESGARRMVGRIFDTYWLFEMEGCVYAVDQHAAHEKILYEKLMKQTGENCVSQELLPPAVISLGSMEMLRFEEMRGAFSALGFSAEEFGEKEVIIRAVPYTLGAIDPASLFYEILSAPDDKRSAEDLDSYTLRIATEACKAAVKGGGPVSSAEAEAMMDELMKLEDPYHCPHGRPTIIRIEKADMERKFGRKK